MSGRRWRWERRLRAELAAHRAETAVWFAAVRQEMAAGFAAVRQEMASEIRRQTWWLVTIFAGFAAVLTLAQALFRWASGARRRFRGNVVVCALVFTRPFLH